MRTVNKGVWGRGYYSCPQTPLFDFLFLGNPSSTSKCAVVTMRILLPIFWKVIPCLTWSVRASCLFRCQGIHCQKSGDFLPILPLKAFDATSVSDGIFSGNPLLPPSVFPLAAVVLMRMADRVGVRQVKHRSLVHVRERQSCKMSRIWRRYPCHPVWNFGRFW